MATEPRTTRAREKRAQIVAAARKRFLADGVAATSVDAITAEAGVSKQTVYVYFDGKDDLLRAVLDDLVVVPAVGSTSDEPPLATRQDLEAALASFASRAVTALMEPSYLAAARIVITETPREPAYGALFASTVAGPILEALASLLERAHRDGAIGAPPAPDSPRLLVGALLTFTLIDGLLRPDDVQPPDPARLRAIVSEYVDGLPPGRH